MSSLDLQASSLYPRIQDSDKRITLLQGSSRSSKTYSMMQFLMVLLLSKSNIVVTVARKTLPALKSSAYRDFLEIMHANGLYNQKNHNKTELIYMFGSSMIEFISVDNFEKVKGRKRDYLFMNEANEMSYYDFNQLSMRTSTQIYMDFNPSHSSEHWIEEKIKTRDDVNFIHSTYKDNPFLTSEIIFEIERLQHTDPNLWRIYGLGELGIATARVYNHFNLIDKLPDEYHSRTYGLDFGFNHPMALIETREKDDEYFVKELAYLKGCHTADLIELLPKLGVSQTDVIYCDHELDRIKEIQQAGYNAQKANKSVDSGIDTVKSKKISVTKDSINLLREYGMYSYKTTADGKILDDVVKLYDDALDALRYSVHSAQNKTFVGFV